MVNGSFYVFWPASDSSMHFNQISNI
jgi:hypothetical protein